MRIRFSSRFEGRAETGEVSDAQTLKVGEGRRDLHTCLSQGTELSTPLVGPEFRQGRLTQ